MTKTTSKTGTKKPANKKLSKPKTYIFPNTDIEVPTNLPRPSKGRKLTKEDRVKIAEYVCKVYATDDFTINDTLLAFGIHTAATWHTWIRGDEQIKLLYDKAIQAKNESYFPRLREKARSALEKVVEGYTVTTTEVKRTPVVVTDINGKITVSEESYVEEKKIKQVYIKPMPQAIMYALDNLDKDNFTRNPEPTRELTSRNELDHWNEQQIEDEIKRLEKDGY